MSYVAPPPPPVAVLDEDPRAHIYFRLWQIVVSAVTVAATAAFFMLHPIAGILAIIVAKHVLVAVLASGLIRYPGKRRAHVSEVNERETASDVT
jgi:hypothetical protein